MPKYIVPGIPSGAQLSAFMPHWNRLAQSGAQQYKIGLTGQPGTQGIPAPTSNTVPCPDLGDIAQMGSARSSDAPDMWYPQLYYSAVLDSHPGPVTPVRIYSDNMLPVPARDPRGKPALLARPVLQRGQSALHQPRVAPRWG